MGTKKYWDIWFAPCYTPMEMLSKGVFMDCAYTNAIKGIDAKYKKHPKTPNSMEEADHTKNYYGVKSRQSLKVWQDNGWIKTDKLGWWEWYIKYFNGRRLPKEEDSWQVGRWSSFVARHNGQVQAKCKVGDKDCNTKQRQGLLQWSWNSDLVMDAKRHISNVKKMAKATGCKLPDGWQDEIKDHYERLEKQRAKKT